MCVTTRMKLITQNSPSTVLWPSAGDGRGMCRTSASKPGSGAIWRCPAWAPYPIPSPWFRAMETPTSGAGNWRDEAPGILAIVLWKLGARGFHGFWPIYGYRLYRWVTLGISRWSLSTVDLKPDIWHFACWLQVCRTPKIGRFNFSVVVFPSCSVARAMSHFGPN
jgi:hypothetical protein